jgi:nucleoside-diphosphate-sugar epimerase
MITHVLVGYGYCAAYLAKTLIAQNLKVMALSRQTPKDLPQALTHIAIDIASTPFDLPPQSILYYFVPPSGETIQDPCLSFFLSHLKTPPLKIIYIGSSGIYGHHQGEWVTEQSVCHIKTRRQMQRKNHEQQFSQYAKQHKIPCALLRTAGIFGPHRLPIESAKIQTPLIYPEEAPLINHIYVEDLAMILTQVGLKHTLHGAINIADGQPQPMGYLQQQCAMFLGYSPAPYVAFSQAYSQASPFKQEFMQQNKRLDIQMLKQLLKPCNIEPTPIDEAIAKSRKTMHDKE